MTTTGKISRNRIGATPAKLAVVGVLALVLVGVVASNFRGAQVSTPLTSETVAAEPASAPTVETVSLSTPAPEPSTTVAAGDPSNPFGEFAVDESWPAVPLREVISFDPLATAAWAKAATAEESADQELTQEEIDQLLEAKNAIIYTSGDESIARIGEREFHVGDVLGRFRISDISSAGVVLSEIE